MLASYFLDGSATRNFDAFLRIWDCSFAVVLPLDRYQFGCWKLWHRWDNGSPQMDQLKVTWVPPVARKPVVTLICVKVRKRSQKRERSYKRHIFQNVDWSADSFLPEAHSRCMYRWIPCTTQVVFKMRILMPSATGIWENLLCMGRWVEKNIGIQWRKRYLWLRKNNISIHFMHAILSGFEI